MMKNKILIFFLVLTLSEYTVYSQCTSLDPFYSQITTESTWQKVSIGTNEKINDISFFDSDNGIIVGDGSNASNIYETSNGGLSWTLSNDVNYPFSVPSTQTKNFVNAHFYQGQKIITKGYGYTATKSFGIGGVWDAQYLSTLENYTSYFLSATEGWVSGYYSYDPGYYRNTILYTKDGGNTWRESINATSLMNKKITSIHYGYPDVQRGYAVSDDGDLFRCYGSSIYGNCTAWQFIDDASLVQVIKLNSVFVLDNKVLLPNGDNIYGYVVGDNGYVGRIQDNELEQIDFSSASQFGIDLNDIKFVNKDLGFIVGDNGHIYMTKDAGLTWDKMNTNISEDLFTVEYAGCGSMNNTIFVGGSGGALYRFEPPPPPKLTSLTKSSDFITENGTQDVIITANLDKAPNNGPVEINFNISGTAQRNVDYIFSNDLVIDQGTSGSFVISGLQDELVEGTETIDLTVSSVTNADYDVTYGVSLNVIDDDIPPKLTSLTKSSDFITENGTQDVIITANLDKAPNNGPVEINFNISGTAQRNVDYIFSNDLVIDQGTSGSFVISGLQDELVEGTETIDLTVSSVTNADYDVTYGVSLNVIDDDIPPCEENLSFNGTINTGASPSYNRTDSLNPDQADYRIISLPFTDYSPADLVSGMRSSDQYRLWEWNTLGGSYSNAFLNQSVGKGYMFLSTLTPNNIIGNHNECLTSLTINFGTLVNTEWVMIGNPYLQTLDWSKIEADNNFTGGGFMVYNGGWSMQNNLSQLRGAFINVSDYDLNSITIKNPKLNIIEKDPTFKEYSKIEGDEWLLDLELKGGNMHHKISQIGQRDDASDGKDRYDLSIPPSLDKAFDIRFNMNTTRDIRSTGDEDISWVFDVENEYSSKAMLRWSFQSSPENNIYLLDTKTGDLVNMLTENTYAFTGKGDRFFKILKGSNIFINEEMGREVGSFRLYPNPTNDYVYIENYSMVESKNVKIYSILGQELTPSSIEVIKSDDLSQIFRLEVDNLKKGNYLVFIRGVGKSFVIN